MYFDIYPNVRTDDHLHRIGAIWWGKDSRRRRIFTKTRGRVVIEVGGLSVYIGRLI